MPDELPIETKEEFWPGGAIKARFQVLRRADDSSVRHGVYESFHPNGRAAQQGRYQYGEPVGTWVRWDDSGQVAFEGAPADDSGFEPDPGSWDDPIEPASPVGPARPWGVWLFELAVVLALAWLPYLVYALVSLVANAQYAGMDEYFVQEVADLDFLLAELPMLVGHLQVLFPMLYICWRSDLGWRQLGLVRPSASGLLLIGPLLGAVALGADVLLVHLFRPEPAPHFVYLPTTSMAWSVLVLSLVFNSLAEELVWRGFVLQRLKQMSGSAGFALAVSTLLFAAYHIYQGFGHTLLVALTGLLFGASVLLTKRLWPAVVAHTMYNIIVMSPLSEQLYPPVATP